MSGQLSDGLDSIVTFKAGLDGTSAAAGMSVLSALNANGSFTLTPTVLQQIFGGKLADGAHTLHLLATDAAGNTSTLDLSFVLDTAAPTMTAALTNDTGVSATDRVTSDDTVSGQLSDAVDSIVTLKAGLDGTSAAAGMSVLSALNPDGSFTLTPKLIQSLTAGTLADGAHTLHLLATDATGNTSTFDLSFVLDTAAPTMTAALANDTGVSATDRVTSDDTVSGKLSDATGNIVTFKAGLDGTTAAAGMSALSALNANGSFTLTPAVLQQVFGGKLADGAHTLHLLATDAAGNTSTFDLSFVLDTAAPTMTAALANDTGVSATDRVTSDDTVSGQLSDAVDSIVTFKAGLDGTSAAAGVSVLSALNPDGSFTLSPAVLAQVFGGKLADGVHALHLLATDAAGNTSTFDLSFVLDTPGPGVTATLANDTGMSATDRFTSDDTVSGKLSDAVDNIVTFKAGLDGTSAAAGMSVLSALNPDGSFTLTPAVLQQVFGGKLADGAHTLHLLATDAAGNTSTFDLSLVLDTAGPGVTATLANDTGVTTTDGVTADDTVAGKLSDATDSIVTFKAGLDGTSAAAGMSVLSALNPDGSFTLTPAVLAQVFGGKLADGGHTLHLLATDAAGNTSTFDLSFVFDKAAPVITAALANDKKPTASPLTLR